MKIEKRQTETYVITEVKDLDPVTVHVTNYGAGKGKVTIECFGEAWSHYWGGMGDSDLQQFVLRCNNDYLANKLVENTRQTDFDAINKIAKERGYPDIVVTNDVEVAMLSSAMAECFGDDWYMDLPTCETSEYRYVCKILNAVKEAFAQDGYDNQRREKAKDGAL